MLQLTRIALAALLAFGFAGTAAARQGDDTAWRCDVRPPATGQTRLALVIGISNYDDNDTINPPTNPSMMSDLPNAANDGEAVSRRLCALGFDVYFYRNAYRQSLSNQIAEFSDRIQRNPDAVALFYYAGHAIELNGQNWLVPRLAELSEDLSGRSAAARRQVISGEAIPLQDVFDAMRRPDRSGHVPGLNLIFIDACRSNPWRNLIYGRDQGPQYNRLAEQESGVPETVLFFSASSGQSAIDAIDSNANSPFATALLAHIGESGLSLQDGLFARINLELRRADANLPQPVARTNTQHRFCFAGCDPRAGLGYDIDGQRFVGPTPQPGPTPPDAAAILAGIGGPDWSRLPDTMLIARLVRAIPFSELQGLATGGNRRAQWVVGASQMRGLGGVPINPAAGVALLRRSAEQDEPRAAEALGSAYLTGIVLRRDVAQARTWFRRAADLGDLQAQAGLGGTYILAGDPEQNLAEATLWLRRAADQGGARGQLGLAIIARDGIGGTTVNRSEALRLMTVAANQGDDFAQLEMGLAYQANMLVPADQDQALNWYGRAAEQGNSGAQLNLGMMRCQRREIDMCARWLMRAHQIGHPAATWQLGFGYANGFFGNPDMAQARVYFEQAARRGYPPAYSSLALMHLNALNTNRNVPEAVRLFRLGAAAGDPFAQFQLGQLLLNGTDRVPADTAEARRLIDSSASFGFPDARNWLIQHSMPIPPPQMMPPMWFPATGLVEQN